jgi:glycosyltransferase involved in cell wall biosynthesis
MLLSMQKIALIIPCYNEEFRIKEKNIVSLVQETKAILYFVNDGSTDNTLIVLEQYCLCYPDRCFIINYEKNQGKAAVIYKSVKEICSNHKYDYIGYFDADFSTPPIEIKRLIHSIIDKECQFVIGSRIILLNSIIKRKWYRHIIGRVILTLINFKHHLDIYDTQCGAKLFSTEIINLVFDKPFKTSWLFDTEIFIRIKKLNLLQKGKEIPLEQWTDYGGSKLSWKSSLKILKELYIILKT